jgi:hypothetical protein
LKALQAILYPRTESFSLRCLLTLSIWFEIEITPLMDTVRLTQPSPLRSSLKMRRSSGNVGVVGRVAWKPSAGVAIFRLW